MFKKLSDVNRIGIGAAILLVVFYTGYWMATHKIEITSTTATANNVTPVAIAPVVTSVPALVNTSPEPIVSRVKNTEPELLNFSTEALDDIVESNKEKHNPFDYLHFKLVKYQENPLFPMIGIYIDLENKAQWIDYKDVELEVSFYSKTKSLIGTSTVTIYKLVERDKPYRDLLITADRPNNVRRGDWYTLSARVKSIKHVEEE